MTLGPLLSLFPGIDILGRAFEEAGFCVVRGPDLIFGGDIRSFHAPPGAFEGVFGGSPCPDFSKARRSPASGEGMAMLQEFQRVVFECRPDWFLLENVVGVPSVTVEGYKVQRFNLNARECGLRQNRNRCFQFGNLDGAPLVIKRLPPDDVASRCCLAREAGMKNRRGWSDFCLLQGLPGDFDLPSFTKAAKYRAVGNAVPLPMGRVVARSISDRTVTELTKLCLCGCGRPLQGRQVMATAGCRKRMERRRSP